MPRNPVLPPLVWIPSPNFSARRERVQGVVVHETQGSYAAAVSWFSQPRSQVSAHVVLREDGLQAAQCVRFEDKAWHAVNANSHTLGIELAGYSYGAKDPNDPWQIATAARIVAYWCHVYAIPARQGSAEGYGGIVRHRDLGAYGGSHTDPSGFDWPAFVTAVAAQVRRGHFRPTWGRS